MTATHLGEVSQLSRQTASVKCCAGAGDQWLPFEIWRQPGDVFSGLFCVCPSQAQDVQRS